MDVYILDELLRREHLIDRYESFIWTERYSSHGDFQLDVHSTHKNRSLLTEGRRVSILKSRRLMVIESVQNSADSNGRELLTVTGRSLEATMTRVPLRPGEASLGDVPETVLPESTPAEAMRLLFQLFMNSPANARFMLPSYVTGSDYPPNTIAEPEQLVNLSFKPMDLYRAVKETAQKYGLGFRLYRYEIAGQAPNLMFDVYTGDDRTSMQNTKTAVIFSSALENLSNITQFRSIEGMKNVLLVLSKNGARWVYANDDTGHMLSGWDIHADVITVDSDLPDSEELSLLLQQVGKEELNKYKPIIALDGELQANGIYQYDVHYSLGDLVEMRSDDGVVNRMRVQEQIFVSDEQGDRMYPTLAVEEIIEPDTWNAWDAGGVWNDAKGVWAFAGKFEYKDNILLNGGLELGSLQEWSPHASSTLTAIDKATSAANVRTGERALRVQTTAANGGAAGTIAHLGPTPTGAYRGGLWFKGPSGNTYTFRLQEYTAASALVGSSSTVSIVSNGGWQKLETTYSKLQEDSLIRVSLQKATAGTFYVDDAYINKL